MNAKEVIGMKIIDKSAYDLGKIAEMKFNLDTFKLDTLYGSVGNPISKKYYNIPCDSILTIGDYLQVSETKESLADKTTDKILDDEKNIKINELIGKKVLDINGNECGKISSVDIDFEKLEINELEVEGSSSFGKSKLAKVITNDDINGIGDYVILNKKITLEEKKSDKKDKKDTEETEEPKKTEVEIVDE